MLVFSFAFSFIGQKPFSWIPLKLRLAVPVPPTTMTVFIDARSLTARELLVEWLGVEPFPIDPGLTNPARSFGGSTVHLRGVGGRACEELKPASVAF